MNKFLLPLLACAALARPATADEASSAAAKPADADAPASNAAAVLAIDPSAPLPAAARGPAAAKKDEYRARLQALANERAAHARAAREADEAAEARRVALAGENEEVGALVAEVADLEARLKDARAKLQTFYDADEALSGFVARREAERTASVEAHRVLQTAIAAAMRGRAEAAAALEAELEEASSATNAAPAAAAPTL